MPHPDLAPAYAPEQIDEKLAQYAVEGLRLKELSRQITVVYDALSGVRSAPRKTDFAQARPAPPTLMSLRSLPA